MLLQPDVIALNKGGNLSRRQESSLAQFENDLVHLFGSKPFLFTSRLCDGEKADILFDLCGAVWRIVWSFAYLCGARFLLFGVPFSELCRQAVRRPSAMTILLQKSL